MSESQPPRKLDPKILKQVTAQIHRRYTEFDGCQPKVRLQSAPPVSAVHPQTFLLTFSTPGSANTSQGPRKLPRYLRVVIDPSGKILKITTSR
jgi:hypothetical protein